MPGALKETKSSVFLRFRQRPLILTAIGERSLSILTRTKNRVIDDSLRRQIDSSRLYI